jgi:hypothetical protein
MKLTASRQEIESARLKMLEARKALEAYQNTEGYGPSSEHQRLSGKFNKAAQKYLKLSQTHP